MKLIPKIIAEVGVNFNGSFKIIKKMINLISKTNVDFIKFQLFKANHMCTINAPLAAYQKKQKNSQYKMLKKYEISDEFLFNIISYCKKCNVKPLFSVFDISSFKTLLKHRPTYIKIPSGEITNFPLLEEISKRKIKVIISTGMSNNYEIKEAIEILLKGKIKKKDIFILHCHSEYPSRLKDLNLSKIPMLKKKFKCKVGFSDHSIGNLSSIISTCLGAEIIEKHITLNRNLTGPDHSSSLEIKDLKKFINDVKNVHFTIGNENSKRSIYEERNKKIVRKSVVATKKIKKGEVFTIKNLDCKRPGNGLHPKFLKKILGTRSKKNFETDDLIKL